MALFISADQRDDRRKGKLETGTEQACRLANEQEQGGEGDIAHGQRLPSGQHRAEHEDQHDAGSRRRNAGAGNGKIGERDDNAGAGGELLDGDALGQLSPTRQAAGAIRQKPCRQQATDAGLKSPGHAQCRRLP